MKELVFLSAQPDDLLFSWQVQTQLHNFRKYGYSDKAHVLVFLPSDRLKGGFNPIWKEIEKQYPESRFYYYPDGENITGTFIKNFSYIPLLRPWMLKQHFALYPELEKKAIFYHDSDVVFTRKVDWSPFVDDDVNYLSYTGNEQRDWNYIDYHYFTRKIEKVEPDKIDSYNKINPPATLFSMFDLEEEFVKEQSPNTGGAQYILKNINSKLWGDIFDGCLYIRNYLKNINQKFMVGSTPRQKEDNGFQSWCADMWSILFTLWRYKRKTSTPKEMDFAWATDDISKWDKVNVYHDAGTTTEFNLFNKRDTRFVNNWLTPFDVDLSYVSKQHCSYNYVKEILQTKNYINSKTLTNEETQ